MSAKNTAWGPLIADLGPITRENRGLDGQHVPGVRPRLLPSEDLPEEVVATVHLVDYVSTPTAPLNGVDGGLATGG
jgi:hypothetical protein